MPGEREGASERLAGFIVDSLHDAGLVDAGDMPRAIAIAAEEIAVIKAMGDYWCSWCSLKAEASPGVQANDEAIRFAADGVELQLKRLRRVESDGRIALEIQARGGSFSGCYTSEIRINDLLRFASALRAASDAGGGNHTATLRNVADDAAIELTVPARSGTGRYLFRAQKPNGVAAELSGSFIANAAILDTLARELRSLVHDCWAKA